MIIEAEYKQAITTTTVRDFPVGTALYIANSDIEEKKFPNCGLSLVIKTNSTDDRLVRLRDGYTFPDWRNTDKWKAIEANVKIVNG